MSWEATSYVKRLKRAPTGVPLTRSEKLLLLILADYHNTEQRGAWPSANTLAADSLLTVRHVRRVLAEVKKKQIICTSRRRHADGDYDSNMYHFHALDCGDDHLGGSDTTSLPTDTARSPRGSDTTSLPTDIRTRGSDVAKSPRVVTPDAQPSLYEPQEEPPTEGPHTRELSVGKEASGRVCASKYDLETLRNYAWASHNYDRQLQSRRPSLKIDGIRNPEGWAIVAHREGDKDALVDEWVNNPDLFKPGEML